jgi:hypothetical protein
MPLQKIELRPGINRESTTYSNEGGYYSGDKIRFRSGFPEKIGGWTRLSNTTFLGTCRALVNWASLTGSNYVGVGTNLKYYIELGGIYSDVTPILDTIVYSSNMSVPYTTLDGTITAEVTSLTLTSTMGFAPSGVIKIDSEQIYYGSISGAALSLLSRGYNSTTAASHTTGAGVGTSTITFNDITNTGQNNGFVTFTDATGFGGISNSSLNIEHQITKTIDSYYYFTVAETALGTLSNVAITGINGQFSCAASSPIKAVFGNSVVISGVNSGGGSIIGYVNPTKYYITAANAGGTTFTLSATQNGLPIDSAAGTPIGLTYTATSEGFSTAAEAGKILSSVVLTGITGAFTCASTPLAVGMAVGISGTYSGTGSISGYTSPSTYYIILTNGTTTFTLSSTPGGVAITTTAGTPTPSTSGGPLFGACGGDTLTAAYQVTAGLDIYTVGLGWGANVWGRGTWGSEGTTGLGQQLRLWTHDNYGEDLIFAPRGGAIYYWASVGGVSARGIALSTLATAQAVVPAYDGNFVPKITNQVIMSGDSRFVLCLGANSYDPTDSNTDFDPMLVRWSDQENPYQWVPAVTNQCGEYRLSSGSYIVCGQTTRQETLIWTSNALYSLQYLGPPYVFGINLMSGESSIMSPRAMFTVNNVTYWMGTDKFYSYSGRVETLPCTLKQYIFNDINRDQSYQVFSGGNEGYNEIWWYYCSAASTTIDRYVIYNHLERIWYYGTLDRTAWLDSSLRPYPMATDYNNRILYHESSSDDESGTTPVAISAYIESSDFDISDGQAIAFVWRMLPDVSFVGSTPPEGVPPQVILSLEQRRNSGTGYGPAGAPLITSDVTITGTGVNRTATSVSTMFNSVTIDTTTIQPLLYALQTPMGTWNITAKTSSSVVTITTPKGYVNEIAVLGKLWAKPTVTRIASYPIEEFTGQIYTRIRGRQMLMRIESERLGTRWQLGSVRIDIRTDGRR